jgi:hypothetical protein
MQVAERNHAASTAARSSTPTLYASLFAQLLTATAFAALVDLLSTPLQSSEGTGASAAEWWLLAVHSSHAPDHSSSLQACYLQTQHKPATLKITAGSHHAILTATAHNITQAYMYMCSPPATFWRHAVYEYSDYNEYSSL